MRTSFAPITSLNAEEQYWAIWNQIYLLKEYCHLSLFEQRLMTGEERVWYIERHNEELRKREENQKRASRKQSVARPKIPNISKPSIRR